MLKKGLIMIALSALIFAFFATFEKQQITFRAEDEYEEIDVYNQNWNDSNAQSASELWAESQFCWFDSGTKLVKSAEKNGHKGLEITSSGASGGTTVGFGPNQVGNLNRLEKDQIYTFSMYLDRSELTHGTIYLCYYGDEWTAVDINADGTATNKNAATITNLSYVSNVLKFDFKASYYSGNPTYMFMNIYDNSDGAGGAVEDEKYFIDDFRIYQTVKKTPKFEEAPVYSFDWNDTNAQSAAELWTESQYYWFDSGTKLVKSSENNDHKGLEITSSGASGGTTVGFGPNQVGNLNRLEKDQIYTFSMYLDRFELTHGTIYLCYLGDEWTAVDINADGTVTNKNAATITNLSYINNVLQFDFKASYYGGNPTYMYMNIYDNNDGAGGAVEGEKYFIDDFKIVPCRSTVAMNYEAQAVGTKMEQQTAGDIPYCWNVNMDLGLTIAQQGNGNKYLRAQATNTTGENGWFSFYLNNLPVQDNQEYRLEFDVIGDGWKEFYIRYNDNVYSCASINKTTVYDISNTDCGDRILGSTFDGTHVTFDFIPSSTISNWWTQVYIIVMHDQSVDFGVDNVVITRLPKLEIEDVTLGHSEPLANKIQAYLNYGEGGRASVPVHQLTYEAVDQTSAGAKDLTLSMKDNFGKNQEKTIKVNVTHENVQHFDAVAATCTTAGSIEYWKCPTCNKMYSDENCTTEVTDITVAALGHALVDDAAVAATCTTDGKTAGHHCSRCDYTDGGETIAALGHQASDAVYHTDDKHFNICTRCGFALDFENLSAPTDYTDARWTQRKYTTEWVSMSGQMRVREKNGSKVVNMAAGYSTTMQYILNFNGTTPIAKGNAFTIDLGNYFSGAKPMGVKVSLLVKFGGYTQTVYVIGSTDDYYTFPVTTAFETFTYVADMEVEVYEIRITNKSNNSGNFYLYMDNVRIFTTMNTANHTMTDDPTAPAQAATCTEAGKTAGKMCSCGYKVEGTTIDALGHDLVEDAAVAPTCTESGKTAGHHCTRCDYKDGGETIEAKGHTLVDDLAVAATCTEKGKTAGQHCSVCNAVIVAQTDIPALGHDLVDDPAVAATCTEAGKTAGHHCSRCDYTDGGDTVPATGHDWVEWVQTKAPTTTEEGEETRTCKNDPTHTETRPVDRLPENPTTQAPTTQAPVTQAPATQAPQTQAPKTQTEPAQTGKKGCKSSIGIGAVLFLASFIGIAVVKRRKEQF